MSNVFMLLDFQQKCNLYRGGVLPTGGVKYPQSDKAICFIHLQQNQSTGFFSLKLKII